MNAKRTVSFARTLAGQEALLLVAGQPDEWDDAASLMISADIRSEAGFSPALVFDIQVPKGDSVLTVQGEFRLTRGDEEGVITAKRCEAWILSPGPRKAINIEFADRYPSLASDASTLYKLFFSLPLEDNEEAMLKLPLFSVGASNFRYRLLRYFVSARATNCFSRRCLAEAGPSTSPCPPDGWCIDALKNTDPTAPVSRRTQDRWE